MVKQFNVSRIRRFFNGTTAAVTVVTMVSAGIGVATASSNVSEEYHQVNASVVSVVPSYKTGATVTISVIVDGKTKKVKTKEGLPLTIALADAGINVSSQDEVSVPLGQLVKADMRVKVVRVRTKTLVEEFVDKHGTVTEKNNSMSKGERVVATKGKDGKGTRNVTVTYRDGKETSRVVALEVFSQPRVDEKVLLGTRTASSAPASSPVSAGSARAIAKSMFPAYGWGDDQFGYVDALWNRESHWNPNAHNASSGAHGIPQAMPGSKMASAGADWRTNPVTQIKWGLNYIKSRYGSPRGAWAHSQSYGWY